MSLMEESPCQDSSCLFCGQTLSPTSTHPDYQQLCENCFLKQSSELAHGDKKILHAGFAEALSDALDLREHETGLHSRRVACHTQVLARRFTDDSETLNQIYWGALLHDLGKITVPDRILLKEGPLDADEWAIMRRHPEDGYRIISHLQGMELAAEIVLCHDRQTP